MSLGTPLYVAAIAPKTTRALRLIVAPNVEELCTPWLDNHVPSTDKPMARADSDRAEIRRGMLAALGLALEIGSATRSR